MTGEEERGTNAMTEYYSKAYSAWGASMGRNSGGTPEQNELCKLHRVPIDSGGYDPGGAYWGTGEPLWRMQFDGGEHYARAHSRYAAFLRFSEKLKVDFRVRP